MSDRAFLLSLESRDAISATESAEAVVLTASYQLPIMWLSLFAAEDIVEMSIPVLDHKGRESEEKVPTLVVSVEKGKNRARGRREAILAHIPEALWKHVDEFFAFLDTIKAPYLQLELVELFSTTSPGDFEEELRGYLLGFESKDAEGWLGLLQSGGFEERGAAALSFDAETIAYGIRGYGVWED